VLAACCHLTFAVLGVDVSSEVTEASFKCLKSDGYTFAVMRCYQSLGRVDPNCATTIKNAWAGGMEHVDAYIFPCHSCGNGGKQVNDTVDYLKKNDVKFGMLWFDIEGPGVYWGSSQEANAKFFEEMVEAAKHKDVKFGVYTSKSQWVPIMGSYSGGSKYPLWYANYDKVESFADFSAFNGWEKPSIKQFEGSVSVCSAGVDKNWYP
jgi:GH25 family lysozyme M1 (1,4-beta-N-acetylmuramidase)